MPLLNQKKIVTPTTKLTFLGIVIDTATMTVSIDESRKAVIIEELQIFRSLKKCQKTKCQILSLIGKLSFTCKVVPAGHIFLRCLIDLSMKVKYPHHQLAITLEAKQDLAWWQDFLPNWSGPSIYPPNRLDPQFNFSLMPQGQMDGEPSGMGVGYSIDGSYSREFF